MSWDDVECEISVAHRYPSDIHAAFIRDILTDLTDKLRQLVFADWLEENGEQDYAAELRQAPIKLWETLAGELIPVRYLNDDHIANILTMCDRKDIHKERRRRRRLKREASYCKEDNG